jgi:hypothetical protein
MAIETGFKAIKWSIRFFQWLLIAFAVAFAAFLMWLLWALFFSGPPITGVAG